MREVVRQQPKYGNEADRKNRELIPAKYRIRHKIEKILRTVR